MTDYADLVARLRSPDHFPGIDLEAAAAIEQLLDAIRRAHTELCPSIGAHLT